MNAWAKSWDRHLCTSLVRDEELTMADVLSSNHQLIEAARRDAASAASPRGGTMPVNPPSEGLGAQIGPYKLLSVLGQGGMGTVYLAEQAQPVRRHVALKIIKLGMDTHAVVARFDAERQALAM